MGLHTCTACQTVGEWGPSWSWYGSLKVQEDGGPIIKVCSEECKAKAQQDLSTKATGPQGRVDPKETERPVVVRTVIRKEDMSATGYLSLHRQEDGDIVITVAGEDDAGEPTYAFVEFVTPFLGGGNSPKTMAALGKLMEAMAADNVEWPARGKTETE